MKVSIGIAWRGLGPKRRDFGQLVEYVVEAEKLGVGYGLGPLKHGVKTRLRHLPIWPRAQAGSGSARASCRSARECPR